MVQRLVIFDSNMNVHDAWALMVLLRGERDPNSGPTLEGYKVAAITTVCGATSRNTATVNTLRILNAMGRTDIPVYRGCEAPYFPDEEKEEDNKFDVDWGATMMVNSHEWGLFYRIRYKNPGFGSVKFPHPVDRTCLQQEQAVVAMYQIVCENPGNVDFIFTGPLTNLAVCINMYGREFTSKLSQIFVMTSDIFGHGRDDERIYEFDFERDPGAASIVLANVRSFITMLPVELYNNENYSGLTHRWRYVELGRSRLPAVKLLNLAESFVELRIRQRRWLAIAAILVGMFVKPGLLTDELYIAYNTRMIGRDLRASFSLYPYHRDKANIIAIRGLFPENYRNLLLWAVGLRPCFLCKCEKQKQKLEDP